MGSPIDNGGRPASKLWVVVAQIILAAVGLAACSLHTSAPPSATSTVVAQIIDGDTVVLRFPNGNEETVRLLGIDTPETVDPTRPVQCFGPEASAHLAGLIPQGTPVYLERDIEARDRFGRLLAYIYRSADDLFINAEMLRAGFADVSIFAPNNAHQSDLTEAATSARTRSVGLWATCGGPDVPLEPDEYVSAEG